MKNKHACLIAAILLLAMIAASAANNMYVNDTFTIIDAKINALPENIAQCAEELTLVLDIWKERRKYLDLTMSKPELEAVSVLFEDAIISASHGNESDFEIAMARLGRAIDDLKDLERISAENIF